MCVIDLHDMTLSFTVALNLNLLMSLRLYKSHACRSDYHQNTCFTSFLAPVLTQLAFQSHRLLFSHVAVEVEGEITPERKFALNEYRTRHYQIRRPIRSLLSHRADQRLKERQMTESDTDLLTLPAQLKTKTILCRPKRRLKHYIGLGIKIIVIQLQFNHLRALQCKHRSMAMDDL